MGTVSHLMCGIFGSYAGDKAGFSSLSHRGRDASNLIKTPQGLIGHHLHATLNQVEQPFTNDDNWLVVNCEVYNWQSLSKKYEVKGKNDSEVVWELLQKQGIKIIDEFRGPYALAFFDGTKIYLARDKPGVFPLYFSKDGFSSERQPGMRELHPRQLNVGGKLKYRGGFVKPTSCQKLDDVLRESVKIRAHKDLTVFLSGIDSALLAYYLKDEDIDFKAVAVGLAGSPDLTRAKQLAEKLKIKVKEVVVSIDDAKTAIPIIANALKTSDPVKIEVGLMTYFASKKAGKVAFSGLGADELFGGYARMHRSPHLENKWALLNIYERSTYRDNVIGLLNQTEIRLPYLDTKVIESSMCLSEELITDKKALREIARPIFGDLAELPKKAAQYGTKFSSIMKRPKTEYLADFSKNRSLVALISGGKDSWYSAFTMNRLNYPIKCAIVMQPTQKDSWMFQVQGVDKTPELIEKIGIPVIIQKTSGMKEIELADLEIALKKAVSEYEVEGVVSGAISSEYQRDRIEDLADKIGIASYAPIWGTNQEAYLRRVFSEGFKFKIVHTAADGLDKSWVGKHLGEKEIEEIIELSKKHKFNAAGEGGEFETLVSELPKSFKPLK
ncbi:MAG: diphthine--ammonia ligase [Candidatus Altiarchaeota archaeon]|nr:diphthine--ammonia ligase [Candidatus Altiarchaeota archaeon]